MRSAARRIWIGRGNGTRLDSSRSALGGRLRQAQIPLAGALAAGLALTVVGVLVIRSSRFAEWDAEAFRGFWMMQRPASARVELAVTHTVNATAYVGIALALTAIALIRRRPMLLPAMALTLVGSNLSTQVLKHVVPAHTELLPLSPVLTGPSFPSGHATACMSLVLCAVMVAPVSVRAGVAAAGAAYALAVGYSVVILASHFPSDVIGGFLMAALWGLLAVGVFPASGSVRRSDLIPRASSMLTLFVWVCSLGLAVIGVGIAVGPRQISPVPVAATAALIALVGAASVCGVAALSLRLDALRAAGHGA